MIPGIAFGTHMRAGEITYRHLYGMTYEFTITTYTYSPSPADRCELELFFGDGQSLIIPRINGTSGNCACSHCGEELGNDVRKNIYVGTHTYSTSAMYTIYFEDPNRNGGVVNIQNSVNVPFYVECQLFINPFLGPNNSPSLINPPVDEACLFHPFIHNPGAIDIDGDSLSYAITECRGEDGTIVPGFWVPANMSLDPVTGDLFWNTPNMQEGEYNVAFKIKEWRDGVLIGVVTRDMQINVVSCDNSPPELNDIMESCVVSGDMLQIHFSADDIDGDNITLSASGQPFLFEDNPAIIQSDTSYPGFAAATLMWSPTCEQAQNHPYYVYFRAEDDNEPVRLVDIATQRINVIPQPIDSLIPIPQGNGIFLRWNKSPCQNAAGYYLYRKEESSGFIPDYCQSGLPDSVGFTKIADLNDINDTSFYDNNNGNGLSPGINYCYRITSFLSDGMESKVSEEYCATLNKDIPVITNVDIFETDLNQGKDTLIWSKPVDSLIADFTPPFTYDIFRESGDGFEYVGSTDNINDTIFIDQQLNTLEITYTYRVLMKDALMDTVGWSVKASSLFLEIISGDNTLHLKWSDNTPWINSMYYIYRKSAQNNLFELIDSVVSTEYYDIDLENGVTYCYYIKSSGKYHVGSFASPLLNKSQIACGTPIDLIAPCPPQLSVAPDCERIENNLRWTNPASHCPDAFDIAGYKIYYSASDNGNLDFLSQIDDGYDTTFIHNTISSIAACYAVTAFDSTGNESDLSNIICLDIDSCQLYRLPNVFTPNNDGSNDLFVPFPYDFVEKIELKIYNRWGLLVFETSDPDVNWDGVNKNTNQPCPEGVYFYICDVYEHRLSGLKVRLLKGAVHILRN